MEARHLSGLTAIVALLSMGASARTEHFIVSAPTQEMAETVGEHAERLRRELADEWLGYELPRWNAPCTIQVVTGRQMPASGETTYTPTRGRVVDFRMIVRGSWDNILQSVLPHEISHTVLASHFGQPLPRWADEGACTTVEHPNERNRHEQLLRDGLTSELGIPMNRMFRMREYPQGHRRMLALYSQGYSVSRFLIDQGGRRKFVDFLEDYFEIGSWTDAVRDHYGYDSLAQLQDRWLAWVAEGSGPVDRFAGRQSDDPVRIAAAENARAAQAAGVAAAEPASGDSDGWYLRRRQQVAARGNTESSSTAEERRLLPSIKIQPTSGWGPEQGTLWR